MKESKGSIKDTYGFCQHLEKLLAISTGHGGYWEAESYLRSHHERFVQTLGFLEGCELPPPFLEIGHGFGYITNALANTLPKGTFVTADLNGPVSQQANRVLAPLGIQHAQVDLSKGGLPFGDEAFGSVFMFEVLEHIPDNVRELARELARIVKRRGTLVMSTPNVACFGHRVHLLAGRNCLDLWIDKPTYARHFREYTKQEVITLFEGSGFATKRVTLVNSYAGKVARIASVLIPNSKDTILAAFVKRNASTSGTAR